MAEQRVFPRRIAAGFYLFLALLGIVFYYSWGLLYNTWNLFDRENVGVYALTVVLLGFGITGYLLYRTPPKKAEGPKAQ